MVGAVLGCEGEVIDADYELVDEDADEGNTFSLE